jgi:hypothetical protein
MTHNEYQMAEATIGATSSGRGVVVALTQSNSRLVKQLEENASEFQ